MGELLTQVRRKISGGLEGISSRLGKNQQEPEEETVYAVRRYDGSFTICGINNVVMEGRKPYARAVRRRESSNDSWKIVEGTEELIPEDEDITIGRVKREIPLVRTLDGELAPVEPDSPESKLYDGHEPAPYFLREERRLSTDELVSRELVDRETGEVIDKTK